MVMMLPFLTSLLAVLALLRGRRTMGMWLWALSFAVFWAWLRFHMTSALPISL